MGKFEWGNSLFVQVLTITFINHAKFALGWALIQVNFDPIQEIGSKVGGGCSFMRLWYMKNPLFNSLVRGSLALSAEDQGLNINLMQEHIRTGG